MFSRPKILFLVSLLFVALLNSIPTYLLNFYFFIILVTVATGYILPVSAKVWLASYSPQTTHTHKRIARYSDVHRFLQILVSPPRLPFFSLTFGPNVKEKKGSLGSETMQI